MERTTRPIWPNEAWAKSRLAENGNDSTQIVQPMGQIRDAGHMAFLPTGGTEGPTSIQQKKNMLQFSAPMATAARS